MVKLSLVLFLGVVGILFLSSETLATRHVMQLERSDEDDAGLKEFVALLERMGNSKLGFLGAFDTNNDDKLSREELQSIKEKTSSEEGMTDEEFTTFFNGLDKNGDGFITVEEFEEAKR